MTKLLNQIEAARLLKVDPSRLRISAREGTGPPRIQIGKRFVYPLDQLKAWLQGLKPVA